MIQFGIPLIFGITKIIVKKKVADGISEGISEAKYEVERKITKSFVSAIFNILINVFLLIFSVYLSPFFVEKATVVYLVCSVYFGSIIYGIYSSIINFPLILKFIFEHKLSLKNYIYNEIYFEAHKEARHQINSKNIFLRTLNSLFGKSASSIASSIASSTTRIVIKKVISIVMILTSIFLIYVLIFRMMVAPILIENTTNFNVFQAALYPLCFTLDYFFSTNFLSWIA